MSQAPHPDEDDPRRPRWLGWLIAIGTLAVVFGLLFIGWRLINA